MSPSLIACLACSALLSACAARSNDDSTRPLDVDAAAARDAGTTRDSATPPASDAAMEPAVVADGSAAEGSCEKRAESIYVIDREQHLSSFDPSAGTFRDIGKIACASSALKPFSMSVDQQAQAWVLFNDGKIRQVSTLDASCASEELTLAAPYERFGMGFSASAGSEALFIAGGTFTDLLEQSPSNPASLARVRPASNEVTTLGALSGWPELSGNKRGELFAFYPADTVFSTVTPATVAQLDTDTGATLDSFELTDMGAGYTGQYAFAFWGGRLYIFVKREEAETSEVWRFNLPPEGDGTVTRIVDDAQRIIVGAGVSTCAPVVII